MLVVDYRIAPEHPHPTPVEDCYAAPSVARRRAPRTLGVDPARIGVMGDKWRGEDWRRGVCACWPVIAVARPVRRAAVLIYPMLDDRTHHPRPGAAAVS